MPDDKHIDDLLDRWETGFKSDRNLAFNVMAESERRRSTYRAPEESDLMGWIRNVLARPLVAACFAAAFMLVGVGASQLLFSGIRERPEELTLTYRLSIDPLYRLQAVAGFGDAKGGRSSDAVPTAREAPVLLAGLDWLQGELDLSKPQYERVSALHAEYEVAFDELFVDLLASHRQYKQFDRKRMSNDVIDYFQLYELLQNQKRLSEESARLTAELLKKVSEIIEPQQRERYAELLNNIYPSFAATGEAPTDA